MKVLQLIDSLEVGGAERMAVNYANLLSKEGIDSFLCATRSEGLLKKAINDTVGYLFLNKKKKIDYKAIKLLNSYIRNNEITVIHAHSTSFFLATIIKLFNKNIKLIWHDHYGDSEFLEYRKADFLKICSFKFNVIISVNEVLEIWAKTNLKCNKVMCLNNFIEDDKNKKKETILKGEIGKRIICLANLRHQKDHITLLKAFGKIVKTNIEWTLHCVGRDLDDEYAKTLKQYIKAHDLTNNVFIYGSISDISNVLTQADIGVLSSKSEGLPLALLEYGMDKLAVVATNVGDCSKVITKPLEGVLVDSGDINGFSKALLTYIDNKILRKQSGEALYKRIITSFSTNAIKKKLVAIYTT